MMPPDYENREKLKSESMLAQLSIDTNESAEKVKRYK